MFSLNIRLMVVVMVMVMLIMLKRLLWCEVVGCDRFFRVWMK